MINMTMTLGAYLARTYVFNTLIILLGLLAVIYLFDTVELIRRASKAQDVPMTLVLQMGLLKLPEVGQILFPFAILFGAMAAFWQLNRRSELVVLRSSGFSVWQFLAPVIVVAVALGVLQMTVINPVGAILIGKYEQLEGRYLKHEENQIAIFQEGLWLRQSFDGEMMQDHGTQKPYVILHARKIQQPEWILKNVTVFYFDAQDTFLRRVDAPLAALEPGAWIFKEPHVYNQDGSVEQLASLGLATQLSIQDIEESFSSPASMSFWQLPAHIRTLEETGFDASRLRVHYHNLLSQPLFFAAMILLAATVSMRPPRMGRAFLLISTGIFIGFFVFFMSSYLQALGASQQIPPVLAAWSPALVCLLLGLSAIINLEDG